MQTPDKKKQMFLDMQEHPEKYSEEQIETMMDDLDRLPDVDVAWQEFQQTGQSSPRRWLKAAASIIGVLMLSGIAYAAVHIISRNAGVDEETPTHEVQNINSPLNDDAIVETFTTDSIPQTRIFENTPRARRLTNCAFTTSGTLRMHLKMLLTT